MKLKKYVTRTENTDIELLTSQVCDDALIQEIKDQYTEDKADDITKTNSVFNRRYRFFDGEDDDIVKAIEIELGWCYNSKGEVYDGYMVASHLLIPPVINDDVSAFAIESKAVTPDSNIMTYIKGHSVMVIPDDELMSYGEDQYHVMYMGLFPDLENNLDKHAKDIYDQWSDLTK